MLELAMAWLDLACVVLCCVVWLKTVYVWRVDEGGGRRGLECYLRMKHFCKMFISVLLANIYLNIFADLLQRLLQNLFFKLKQKIISHGFEKIRTLEVLLT